MARRLTFQLPDDIAAACEVANADRDVQRIEEEMEQACDSPDEPWDAEPRVMSLG